MTGEQIQTVYAVRPAQMKQLREELESVCCERERLLSERCSVNTLGDTEMMKASISSLTEERDQLQRRLRDEVEQQQERDQTVIKLQSHHTAENSFCASACWFTATLYLQ